MIDRALARRYAQALFSVVDPDTQASTAEELLAFSRALEDPEINAVFANPRTPKAVKQRLIASLNPSPYVQALLQVMLENRRLSLLRDVAAAFQDLAYAAQGKTKAEVISAVPLSEETVAELKKKLASFTGKEVEIFTRVDERVWGGLVIRVDGKIIDGSLAHAFQRAKEQLLGKAQA